MTNTKTILKKVFNFFSDEGHVPIFDFWRLIHEESQRVNGIKFFVKRGEVFASNSLPVLKEFLRVIKIYEKHIKYSSIRINDSLFTLKKENLPIVQNFIRNTLKTKGSYFSIQFFFEIFDGEKDINLYLISSFKTRELF